MSTQAPPKNGPVLFHEVLWTELGKLRPGPEAAAGSGAVIPPLPKIYERIGNLDAKDPLSALCLSGGGIRSATFNLGVLQALARLGVLGRFDYLSSVSGGGYIASWLRTCMARDGSARVIEALRRLPREGKEGSPREGAHPIDPLSPEPAPIEHLREYSNYLTPRLGIMSADTWAAAAMIVRNVLLNWLVIIPLLAAAVTLPQILLLAFQATDPSWGELLVRLSLLAALVASLGTHGLHRSSRDNTSQKRYLWGSVLPIFVACVLLAAASLGVQMPQSAGASTSGLSRVWLYAALWCIGAPVLGWALVVGFKSAPAGRVPPPLAELLALCGSGAVATLILVGLACGWLSYLRDRPALYAILAVPILLGVYLIARALFVALGSLAEGQKGQTGSPEDASREWWARLSGWILLSGIAWLVLSAVAILGGWALEQFYKAWLPHILAGAGGISGVVASMLASGGDTPGNPQSTQKVSLPKRVLLALAAPLFCLCLGILLAGGTAQLGRAVTGQDILRTTSSLDLLAVSRPVAAVIRFVLVPVGLVALGFLAGSVVNVNRFSLHGFYRNRLVRAYLGASNPRRKPDPFTGFDPKDNLRLSQLWNAEKTDELGEATCPMPVICVTLNLTRGEKLAWQQRKAESFSMTPFYCGSFQSGYRSTSEYGGPNGLSVGTAVTISGAAANPNMGYHSSPLLAFLMTLFNARLGAWLGNPNLRGNRVCSKPGPGQAVVPLMSELFGVADETAAYVNLSDGGHFDNLGLYEMVLRRCRFILVSDAGQDPACSFEDLGNAIRKVRVDFGVPIEYDHKIQILPRAISGVGAYGSGVPIECDHGIQILPRTLSGVGAYCALAKVRYSVVDGTPKEKDGDLIYVKPALDCGNMPDPYDVYSYAVKSPQFPHETTADQWFSEAQFESYRALGDHLVSLIGKGRSLPDLPAVKQAFDDYLKSRAVPPPPPAP